MCAPLPQAKLAKRDRIYHKRCAECCAQGWRSPAARQLLATLFITVRCSRLTTRHATAFTKT